MNKLNLVTDENFLRHAHRDMAARRCNALMPGIVCNAFGIALQRFLMIKQKLLLFNRNTPRMNASNTTEKIVTNRYPPARTPRALPGLVHGEQEAIIGLPRTLAAPHRRCRGIG